MSHTDHAARVPLSFLLPGAKARVVWPRSGVACS